MELRTGRTRPARSLAALAVVLSMLATLLASPPAAAGSGDAEVGVTGVRATDDGVVVTGVVGDGDTVEVYALGTEQDVPAWETAVPVATTVADGAGRFRAAISDDGDQARASHLYYAKYLAVVDGEAVGTYRYVDDNQVTATNDYPFPQSPTKKGLQVQMTADAEELGVGHAGINVALDQLVRREAQPEGGTIAFASGGRTFHFDRPYVEHLDQVISSASDNGVVVNLILILYRNEHPNSAFHELVHPAWDPAGGPVFAFDTVTAEGVAHFTAAVEFIAERWTREDQRFGRATGFIVGNEIDAQWVWSNMGEQPLDEFVRAYERALRLTHQAVRAAYREGRVYTSLTHSWTLPSGPADPPGRYYPGRDVLDALNARSKAHGDYDWHVAHHPYPEDLNDPAFWNDETATDDLETTGRITFKNIELLHAYLQRDELTVDGVPRRVILSEQGCNTPGDDLEAEQLQAACYALAYYKIHFLDAIDAFILHRHVDYKTEFGLRLGLWTWDDERPEQAAPDEQKVIYDVFRDIDTDRSLEATAFALDVIGIDDWSQLVPGWDPTALAVRDRPVVGGTSITARPHRPTTLFDFEDGTQGWHRSDGVEAVEAAAGTLRPRFRFEPSLAAALAKMWRGPAVSFDEPLDATATPFLSARVRIPDDPDIGTRHVKIKAYGADGTVGEGEARLAPGDDWQQVTVDLSTWASRSQIVRLKVWLRGSTNAAWSGTFELDEVTLAPRVTGAQRAVNLAVEAQAAERVAVGRPVTLEVTNHDLVDARGGLELVACDGVEVAPSSLALDRLAPGERRRFEVVVTAADPADPHAPELCLVRMGHRLVTRIDQPPPQPTVLHGFDDGTTQGWTAGHNLTEVAAVSTIANAPGVPRSGTHALEGISRAVAGDAVRRFLHVPDEPLDLHAAAELSVFVNSYGGAPGAEGYEVVLRVHAGDEELAVASAYEPDRWSELTLDVGSWPGRAAIDRIEIEFRVTGDDLPDWSPRFQIDELRWFDEPRP